MDHIDNNAPAASGTPGEDYALTEEDRQALGAVTLTVEFLMVAARAISRGFPVSHPEVAQYLTFARLKMPGGPEA